MTIRCLLCIATSFGSGYAEIETNNLHQLALLMPASVISYDVQLITEQPIPRTVIDAELFCELCRIASAIAPPRQFLPPGADV